MINEFNRNTQALLSEFKKNSDLPTEPLKRTQKLPENIRKPNINNKNNNRNKHNSLEDTFSSSSSVFSDSGSLNHINNNNNNNNNDRKLKVPSQPSIQQDDYFLDEVSTMNELPSLGNINNNKNSRGLLNNKNKKSLSTDNMLVRNMAPKNFNRNNSVENVGVLRRVGSTSTGDRDSSSRPRGRLNFYDSDTFSENFVINGSQPTKNFKKNGKKLVF